MPAGYSLPPASALRLADLHPDLRAAVERAVEGSRIAFVVTEGRRTLERQKRLVAIGASRTLNSRHLTGHAVDLAAMVDLDGDGTLELRWDWPLYFELAEALRAATTGRGIALEWGGCWRRIDNTAKPLHALQLAYLQWCKARKRTPFLDGPHFQLAAEVYP